MPVLPSPAQVGLREPAYPMSAVYVNALKDFFDRGWLATYSRDKGELVGLPRPVTVHGNYTATEVGADRLNNFLPYDIFCVHAAEPTNNLELCRVKIHLNRNVGGMATDALSPSTHKCAYTIILKNSTRKSYADLFSNGKLTIPVVNYTDPLVVHCLENPYRELLGIRRANLGFDFRDEPLPPEPYRRPAPPPRYAPVHPPYAPAYPPRAAPPPPPRATPTDSSPAGPAPSSRPDKQTAVLPSQKRKSNIESDDEVEVIWQGRVEPRGNKPRPINVDSYPSPPRRPRKNSPTPSSSPASSQARNNNNILSVIPLGNRANDLDMLSEKQVAAGKAVDYALIKATEALFDSGHYREYPQSHPGHPDTAHTSLDSYRTLSAENIAGYFADSPANVALRQLTSVVGLHVNALQGLFQSSATCQSCLRFFEGDAMLKHYVARKGTRACAHGNSFTSVSTAPITTRAKVHVPPALLIVPKEYADTFDASIEFPDDALTVAWALWASYIGVPEDVCCLMSTGYMICEKCKRARTFVAHEAHIHLCFQ